MKTKAFFPYILALIILFLLVTQQGCKKKGGNDKPKQPDISVVDISQKTGWNYWIVGKEDYYYLKINNLTPEVMEFHSSEANKDYTIFYDENGKLDKVVVDDYIFIFRNFNGTKVDLGVIYPNSNIEILRDVETGFDWNKVTLKEKTNNDAWSDVIRGAARVAAGVPCALSAAAAIGSGGIATPIALWTCGNFLLGLTTDVMEHDFSIHNGFTDFVDSYSDISIIQGCSTDLTSCASGLASDALNNWADHQVLVENHSDQLQNVNAALKYGYGDVQITLTWDNAVDLDLHVIDPNAEEIYWNNPSSASNGTLDVDDRDGFGPENIYWPLNSAPNGTYQVFIHQYPWDNQPSSSNYTVYIYAFGHSKTFTGHITKDEVIQIASFNKNGINSSKVISAKDIITRMVK